MSIELITNKERYQGLSSDTKPVDASNGSDFFEADTGKEFIKTAVGWVPKALEILADGGNPVDENHPLPVGGWSIYSKNIDIDGSDIGTFTGTITDLVDDLDTTLVDSSANNPKYFEIKLRRPIDNTSIKFCSPVGKNFSNVKITLKDRSGTSLIVKDDSSNNTKYTSNEYTWPLTPWCTIRVEFHTVDEVSINWALIEISHPLHSFNKYIDEKNSTLTPLGAGATYTGEWVSTQNFVQAIIDVVTDQNSATNGLIIELSNDASTVIHSHRFTILSNIPYGHHYPSELENKYYRIKYTNGATPQSTFKLIPSLFNVMVEEGHAHGLDYSLQDDHPAPIVRAVQTGKKPNGDYVNAEYTAGGNPKASIEELETTVRGDLSIRPSGTGINGSVTLVSADTAYAVPAAAPSAAYRINLYNGSDTSFFIGYQNTNANGIELPPGDSAEDDLNENQQLYAYCAAAGKVITFTYKQVY